MLQRNHPINHFLIRPRSILRMVRRDQPKGGKPFCQGCHPLRITPRPKLFLLALPGSRPGHVMIVEPVAVQAISGE
jgi:hypothetical protein